jgi:hypothetical protein
MMQTTASTSNATTAPSTLIAFDKIRMPEGVAASYLGNRAVSATLPLVRAKHDLSSAAEAKPGRAGHKDGAEYASKRMLQLATRGGFEDALRS